MHFNLLRAIYPQLGGRFFRALLLASALTLICGNSRADEQPPGESVRATPGLIRLGLPTPTHAPVVLTGGAAYGWLDRSGPIAGGHRFGGTLGAAFRPLPPLTLGVDVRGLRDSYSGNGTGTDINLYGEPRLTLRYSQQASQALYWGVESDARFIGQEAPSIAPSATSPSLRFIVASAMPHRTWLGANLGFQLDNSANAVPNPRRLSIPDRRSLGASSYNAVQWGLGISHRMLSSRTELLGELSGDLLVGSGSPALLKSPARLGLGARHPLSDTLSLLATAELALSNRPDTLAGDKLVPLDPRLGLAVAVVWRFGRPVPPPPARPAAPPPAEKKLETRPAAPAPPPEPKLGPVSGNVVDEGGRPLADVEVTLLHRNPRGETKQVERTLADGSFSFERAPDADVELQVATPGFEGVTLTFGKDQERQKEIMLRPAVPAGQVRGRVLDLRGNPVLATIIITPGFQTLEVNADGSFELELAPGEYTIKFDHKNFMDQKRSIRVQNRGVVILNIALTR